MQLFPQVVLRRRLMGRVDQRFPGLPASRGEVPHDGAEKRIAQDGFIAPYQLAHLMQHARHGAERMELSTSECPPYFVLLRWPVRLRFGEHDVSIDAVLAIVIDERKGQHEIAHILRHLVVTPERLRIKRSQRRELLAFVTEPGHLIHLASPPRLATRGVHFVPFGPRGSTVSGRQRYRLLDLRNSPSRLASFLMSVISWATASLQ